MRHLSQCGRQALLRSCSPLFIALVLALTGAAILGVPAAQATSPVAISAGELEPAVPMVGASVELTVTPQPTVHGQSLTMTATVQLTGTSTIPAPTGNVDFLDGATLLGSATVTDGVATFATSVLTVGTHSLVAFFSDNGDPTGISPVVTHTVNKADTVVLVDSAPRPSVFGELVTITATVVVTPPGSGLPTGTVTFKDGATVLASSVPLVSGVASITTTSLSPNVIHMFTVEYSGDGNLNPSTSGALAHLVNRAPSATTIVAWEPNPSILTLPVTFTATVTALPPGAGVPTGTLNILDGPAVVATATVVAGVAVIVTPDLVVGTHSITALYQGNNEFVGSTSAPVAQVVVRQPTTITVDGPPTAVQSGLQVNLTATVTSTFGTPISGTITFFDGANVLGKAPAVGGVATLATQNLATGVHTITVAYSGDAIFAPSTSEPKAVTIVERATTTLLGSSPNPSNISRPASFVALVSPAAALQAAGADATGAGTPTGLVLFSDATATLSATAVLQGGVARLVTSALPAGIYSVTALYSGDGVYAPSISQVLLHEVLDAVLATNDAAGTAFATPVTVAVLANDTGSGLAVVDVSDPISGAVVINPDNSVTYTPDLGTFGIDTFNYVARDSFGNVDSALVTVIVGPPFGTNTPPLVGVIDPTGAQTITFPAPGATMTVEMAAGVYPLPLGDKDILYLVFASMIVPLHDAPAGQQYAGYAFALGAFLNNVLLPTVPLGQPVIVTIDYDPESLGAVDPITLGLYYWNGTQWSTDGITLVSHDVAAHRIVFRLAHLSEFALFAEPHLDLYLPQVAR